MAQVASRLVGVGEEDDVGEGTADDGWIRKIRRVFLAGKITGNDWRRELVWGELAVRPGWPEWTRRGDGCVFAALCGSAEAEVFPVQQKAILSMLDYVGPYYVAPPDGSCRCDSGMHNHGTWDGEGKSRLLGANTWAIAHCDLVFAWLDDPSAACTLFELGYASALEKEVFIAGPRYLPELGMIYHADDFSDFGLYTWERRHEATPAAAFVTHLAQRLTSSGNPVTIDPGALSPIEGRFLAAWNALNCCTHSWHGGYRGRDDKYLALFPQYPLDGGRYRLDFAYIDPGALRQGGGRVRGPQWPAHRHRAGRHGGPQHDG
jgi:hypothetical protein